VRPEDVVYGADGTATLVRVPGVHAGGNAPGAAALVLPAGVSREDIVVGPDGVATVIRIPGARAEVTTSPVTSSPVIPPGVLPADVAVGSDGSITVSRAYGATAPVPGADTAHAGIYTISPNGVAALVHSHDAGVSVPIGTRKE
jgi:hypothetical protein